MFIWGKLLVPMSSGSSDDCFLQKGPGHSLSPPRHDQKETATNHISVACFSQPNLSVSLLIGVTQYGMSVG